MSGDRELDVVMFGATGFVGQLVAGYLAGHAPDSVRIGLAGRSAHRLADVRARIGALRAVPLSSIVTASRALVGDGHRSVIRAPAGRVSMASATVKCAAASTGAG